MTSGTYLEGELTLRRSLEESFLTFLSPARDALVALLRKHGKDAQAAALMLSELGLLDLHSCSIGDDGAEIVADFLAHDVAVVRVWLDGCHIGPRGAKIIAESLKHNQTVEYLVLTRNVIGNLGAEALMEALNDNAGIRWVNVFGLSVTPELQAAIEYLTVTRNKNLVPAAVRRASLCLIAARYNISTAGTLAIFPKEIVKMIALEVWATRKDPIWINSLTESERTGKKGD